MKLLEAIDQALRVGPIGSACLSVWNGDTNHETQAAAAAELGGASLDLDVIATLLGYSLSDPTQVSGAAPVQVSDAPVVPTTEPAVDPVAPATQPDSIPVFQGPVT